MIHAFSFTCDRDSDLSNLMVQTLYRHCWDIKELTVVNTDHNLEYRGYGNGAGWQASMLKLKALRKLNPADDDFVLSVDSDVVFGGREVFTVLDKRYGIFGIKHKPEFNTRFGQWSHMSGALIFIRGDIAKKMAALDEPTLTNIRFQHFKPFNITENEDVVLSYLASYVGANQFDLGNIPGLTSNDFESEVSPKRFAKEPCENELCSCQYEIGKGFRCFAPHLMKPELRSFYHLNYCPTSFLGEPVTGKWDIPRVLEMNKIEL